MFERCWSSWDWDSIQRGFDFVRQVLVLLADGASFYIIRYPRASSWPEVSLVDASRGFVSSRVSACGVVVPHFDYLVM